MNCWTPDSCGTLRQVAGETLRPGGLELTEYLLGLADFHVGSLVLDAGCGMGATLRHMTRTRGITAVGVDGSESMLAAAEDNAGESSLFCAPLESLPFAAESFDGIICECVLSGTDVARVLAEFQRVLRMDGLLLVSDLYRRADASNQMADMTTHDVSLTREQTEIMLEEAGFTVEHWEDRTRDLKYLAAQLIMAPGNSGENLPVWFGKMTADSGCKQLGYHLFTARRTL